MRTNVGFGALCCNALLDHRVFNYEYIRVVLTKAVRHFMLVDILYASTIVLSFVARTVTAASLIERDDAQNQQHANTKTTIIQYLVGFGVICKIISLVHWR